MGRPGSGKSKLLAEIASGAIPGWLQLPAGPTKLLPQPGVRGSTLQRMCANLAKGAKMRPGDALATLGLLDARNLPIAELSPSQRGLCGLLPGLFWPAELLLVDGLLDTLDPACLDAALRALIAAGNASLMVATGRPDLAELLGNVLALRGGQPIYCGSVGGLLERFQEVEYELLAGDERAEAMAAPVMLSVDSRGDRQEIAVGPGQAGPVRLLLEGYGRLRVAYLRKVTLAEALREVL